MGDEILDIIKKIRPQYAKNGFPEEHKIIYDSPSETLEPIYYWILDFMQQVAGKVEKLVDNFTSSPGSGHFAELGQRATIMQQNATKIMGDINTVIKSVINIIYDLKEFETRLDNYTSAKSKDKEEAEAGMLSLKQIWLDSVDIKRGNTSIKAMASQFNFVTLIDAFMAAKSVSDVEKTDLNDRIKRILKPRMHEFIKWVEVSEVELRKRFNIEKTYLKSQVNSLKTYTRWAKPYLRAAAQLEMTDMKNPALVKAFSTTIFELTLLGKRDIDFKQTVIDKKLPRSFENINLKRKYYSCVLVDFFFRGMPQRAGQGQYAFGGRAEMTFRGFSLNEDELSVFNKMLEKSDVNEALRLAEGMTEESLKELQADLDKYIENKGEKKEKEASKKSSSDVNPFSALLGFEKKEGDKKEEEKIEKIEDIKKDSYVEKQVMGIAEQNAKETCFLIFDIYKKAHGMASHPDPYG